MYWVASGFVFRRVESPIHALDPRVRLLFAAELFTVALLESLPWQVGVTVACILSLAALGRVLRRLLRTMLFVAGFAAVIFVINLLVGQGIDISFALASRFITIVGATSIFFLTTSPDELEYVMKWFRVPRDMVFAFVTAVRFVPVLMMDAMQILDAQRSRGLEIDRGNFIKRIRNFTPVLIPLVVTAVIRSGELAEAMEARAYGASKRPTSLYTLKIKNLDKAAALLSLGLTVYFAYFFLLRG